MSRVVPAAHGFRITGLPQTPWLGLLGAESLPELSYRPRRDSGWAIPAGLDWAIHPGIAALVIQRVVPTRHVVLHSGALACDGQAWLLVGVSGAGKSTLLHAVHRRGRDVLCDDTSVVADGFVLAGPRCLDLRAPAPGSQPVRNGERHRVTLEPAPWRMPLAGFLHLRWSEASGPPRLDALGPAEGLAALVDGARRDAVPSQAVELMDLAAWPAYALSRRRDADVDEIAAEVVSLLAGRDRTARQPAGSARATVTGRTT